MIWQHSPAGTEEVIAALAREQWHESTIKDAAHFSKHRKLTCRDIAGLKRIIDELDDEHRSRPATNHDLAHHEGASIAADHENPYRHALRGSVT